MQECALTQYLLKAADTASVALPDPGQGSAASAPLPELSVGNKPAPGQTGPKGLAPRTSYSRVNSGSPPPADLGSSTQKGLPIDPQGFLPPKVAHREVLMLPTAHFTIQDMIKAATAGSQEQASASMEAMRQLANAGEPVLTTKQASALAPEIESIPTNYVEKLAAAVSYIVEETKIAEETGPGKGPNPMQVLEATSSKNEIEAGHGGEATPSHIPPMHTNLQRPSGGQPQGPANALEDNASSMLPAYPVKLSSASIAMLRKVAKFPLNEGATKDDLEREPKKEQAAEKKLEGKEGKGNGGEGKKEASAVDPRLVDLYLSMVKSAEDAINPAKISAGAAVPPDTSMSGEAGGAPVGGLPQGPTSLISSNEAAANFTKREAKAPVKAQLNRIVTEPALSAAHDHILDQAFDHTGQAGVKISSALSTPMRTASARALLEKLAADACGPDGKPKKKVSAGMGSFQAPPVGGVGSAGATM